MTTPLHALIYLDYPEAFERRAALRPAHLAYLAEHAEALKAAGPLLDAQGRPSGSLLIFETDHPGAIEALAKSDPYVVDKVVETVRVLQWSLAVWALPAAAVAPAAS